MLLFLLTTTFIVSVWGDFVTPPDTEEITTPGKDGFGALEKCGEGTQLGRYKCVVYHRCDPDTNTIVPEEMNTNGYGLIDIRFGENSCAHPLDVCCKIPEGGEPITSTTSSTTTTEDDRINPKPDPITTLSFCGIRNNNGIDFKITGNNDNEAEYGEFPWMVAILKKNYNPSLDPVLAICGGSLIAPRVVLTGAHCIHKYGKDDIKVRAGEWDTQTQKERLPYQERDIEQIIIHEQFKEGVLYNDVALIILNRPFKKAEHIATICLPNQEEVINSRDCIATGWGKDQFGREGRLQTILKKIVLPIVGKQDCETALRGTRLGKYFQLHNSFICAGGEEGKDTCTGDGGSPLVCPDPKDPRRYIQAGIVAWGIGCGTTLPGVYADVAKFRTWVDRNMQRLNLYTKPYTI